MKIEVEDTFAARIKQLEETIAQFNQENKGVRESITEYHVTGFEKSPREVQSDENLMQAQFD